MSLSWVVAKQVQRAVRLRRALLGPKRSSWDLRYETLAEILHQYANRLMWLPLSVQRRSTRLFLRPTPVTTQFRYETVTVGPAQVRAEWFTHPTSGEEVLLYLHGGGYSLGSIDTHRDFIGRLCLKAKTKGFAVEYRLAPEHPFPAASDDALSAYQHLLDSGHLPHHIVVAGESAGGGLTLALLQRLIEQNIPLPKAAAVISPWLDLELRGPSIDGNANYDFLPRRTLENFVNRYVKPEQRRHPWVSPIHADTRGFPPLLVHVGGAEALADEARDFISRARQAGVRVHGKVFEDMIHAFHLFGDVVHQGADATDEVASFLRSELDEASSPSHR